MDFIVYGALGGAVVVLLLVATGKIGTGHTTRLRLMEGVYQELVDLALQAKREVASNQVADSTVAATLEQYQQAMNKLALQEEAIPVFTAAEELYKLFTRSTSARSTGAGPQFSEDAFDLPYRDLLNAARTSLNTIRGGEVLPRK